MRWLIMNSISPSNLEDNVSAYTTEVERQGNEGMLDDSSIETLRDLQQQIYFKD